MKKIAWSLLVLLALATNAFAVVQVPVTIKFPVTPDTVKVTCVVSIACVGDRGDVVSAAQAAGAALAKGVSDSLADLNGQVTTREIGTKPYTVPLSGSPIPTDPALPSTAATIPSTETRQVNQQEVSITLTDLSKATLAQTRMASKGGTSIVLTYSLSGVTTSMLSGPRRQAVAQADADAPDLGAAARQVLATTADGKFVVTAITQSSVVVPAITGPGPVQASATFVLTYATK
jgi:type 1 fimbria pilin